MVLLTMTDTIVKAIEELGRQSAPADSAEDCVRNQVQCIAPEPSLSEPAIDKPITHGQIMDISRQLKSRRHSSYHLDILLRGSRVYVPPPPPKPEPVSLTHNPNTYAFDRMLRFTDPRIQGLNGTSPSRRRISRL